VNEIAATHGATLEIGDGASGKGCRVELKFTSLEKVATAG
jgi:hypothetical protein